jgi:transposase-like protein
MSEKIYYGTFYTKESIEEILSMYLQGAAVTEISEFVGMSIEKVNEVLDNYTYIL